MPEHHESRPLPTAIPLLHLEVVTPAGLALKDDVDEVVAPAAYGEAGVLPSHLPMLASLRPGSLRYRHGADWLEAIVGSGFVEIGAGKVLVLCDRYDDQEHVDVDLAKADLEAADKALLAFDGDPTSPAHDELERDRAWATARLDVASRRKLRI